jgi:hypothetical protein
MDSETAMPAGLTSILLLEGRRMVAGASPPDLSLEILRNELNPAVRDQVRDFSRLQNHPAAEVSVRSRGI